jgi:hypothetical protein
MWGGWGIYSPNHQKMVVGSVLSHGATDSPGRLLGFDRWSSDLWALWAVRWCTGQVL